MGGRAADNCTGETTITIDDEISNTVPEYDDKVLTQPSKNNCKKSNGSLFPSDVEHVRTDFVVKKVPKQSTKRDTKVIAEEVIVIEDDVKENNYENELHLRGTNSDYTSKQANRPELNSEVKYFNTIAFNELNSLLVNTNASPSKSSDDDDVIFVTTYTTTTTTTTTTAVANSNVICSATSSSVSSPSPPKMRRRRKKRVAVVPRRNPKRIAQMEKASVDLAMKLSVPKRIFGCRSKSSAEVVVSFLLV